MLIRICKLAFVLIIFSAPVLPQWRPWNDLPASCSHIIVIRGEEDRELVRDVTFEESVQLLYPGPEALAVTKEALSRMTPMLCQSLGRIAFGRVAEHRSVAGAVNSFGSGDLLLINLAFDRFHEEDLAKRQKFQAHAGRYNNSRGCSCC